ncbi:hypothetical protein CDAR_63931 [Caerostris darwini]|uniref:Uncharacterized protein n=1 Tax=Caerostris darwini TaxID=1538125 RepID=A0AAV4VLF6_9ARAC|nr:hypothetical protein CDAR_63931 [Caerostris darwini]
MASCFPSSFNLRKQYLDNRNPTPLHCRKGSSHPEIETSNVFQPLPLSLPSGTSSKTRKRYRRGCSTFAVAASDLEEDYHFGRQSLKRRFAFDLIFRLYC